MSKDGSWVLQTREVEGRGCQTPTQYQKKIKEAEGSPGFGAPVKLWACGNQQAV